MLKLQVLAPAPPPGLHRMRLLSRKQIEGKWGKPAFQWLLHVVSGEHEGTQIVRTTATELKLGESLGDFFSEITGVPLSVGSTVDLDEPLGRLFDVLVVQGEGNGVVIRKLTPVDA